MAIVKAKVAFSERNASTGDITSHAFGEIFTVTSDEATTMKAAGLVEDYELIDPTGTKAITKNGSYDVTQYETATVDVDVLTITYNANGGTGTVAAAHVAAGDSVSLSDGTGLTAPTDKEFAGWATTADAEEADVESPYTPEDSITLYAVWADETAEET